MMRTKDYVKFSIASTIYLMVVGVFGGFSTYLGVTAIQSGLQAKGFDLTSPLLFGAIVLWSISVVLLQSYRIRTSNERVSTDIAVPRPIMVTRTDFDLQIIFCGVLLAPFLMGYIIGYFR